MARVPLTNDRWGFETNCFVCEPKNPAGLKIPFFHDEEAGLVVADFELDQAHSGAPNFVHGGISLTILDEAMAWATIAQAGEMAVTVETTSRFLRPVEVGVPYRVEASVVGRDGGTLTTTGRIVDGAGKVRVQSEARFAVVGTDRLGISGG